MVYQTMYRIAPQSIGTDKRITIGAEKLGRAIPMKGDNTRANMKSLIAKGALIQESDHGPHGATYRVLSMASLLANWRAIGATHVIKNRRSIAIVDIDGTPKLGTPTLAVAGNSGVPNLGLPESQSGGTLSGGSNKKELNTEEQEPSSSFELVRDAFRRYSLAADDDAVRSLVSRCRSADANASEAEIAHFVLVKMEQLRSSGRVGNWVGMLITSVPRYFEPPASDLRLLRGNQISAHRRP
jgi:hypothetical protein